MLKAKTDNNLKTNEDQAERTVYNINSGGGKKSRSSGVHSTMKM